MRIIALKFGITDYPNQAHKTHSEPVPYLGGLAIVFGTTMVTYGSVLFTSPDGQKLLLASSILIPALIVASIGLIDDIKQLRPMPRFIAQNFLAFVSAIILVSTSTIGSPFGSAVIDFGVTMLWIVGITNSINFFDNIDGGASGTIAISSLALAVIAISNGQNLVAAMSVVMTGSTMGFLLWNKPPARIYMGDAGSLFLGLLIASLTIRIDTHEGLGKFGLIIPILLLAVPILDTSVAVFTRIRRGLSLFQGGKDHLSHRLMRQGMTKRIAVITLWTGSAVFSLFAVALSRNQFESFRFIVLLIAVAWISIFYSFLRTRDED